jgi:hypothetical protein
VASLNEVGTDPGLTLGLTYADVTRNPSLTPFTRTLVDGNGAPAVTASWFAGPNGVVTNPGAPALPLEINNATVTGNVLRGVGFRAGSFTDTAGVTPLTGAPATELNSPHSPFVSSAFFPSRLWSVNHFGGLLDGSSSTNLMFTPVQYRTDAPGSLTNVERVFSSADLRLFYSNYTASFGENSAALAAPPTIARVDADVSGGDVEFEVRVVGEPAAGIQQVWVTYTGVTAGRWQSLDLVQDQTDSTLWTGSLTGVTADDVEFFVQAVNGVGLVSLDDNLGAYYRPGQIPAALHSAPEPLIDTSLQLVSAPPSASYGAATELRARLTAGAAPVAGETVRFSIGSSEASAITDADGVATVDLPILATPGDYVLSAGFDGTTTHAASSVAQPIAVSKLATSLAVSSTSATPSVGDTGIVATLTAAGVPVSDHTVFFRLTPASGPAVVVARVTGVGGEARLGSATDADGRPLAPGAYTVDAYFGPNAALDFAVPEDPIYGPSSATLGVPVTLTRNVVFASTRTGDGDIYVTDPAGGDPTQLTSGPAIDAEPEWSPNGDKVVFSSTRDGNVELYVMDHDGRNVVRLTTNSAIDTSPAWSPDGTKIAFTSSRGSGGNIDVYVMNADGSGVADRLTTHAHPDLFPAWSPDGTKLAFMSTRTGHGDIYTMNANGSDQRRRTTSSGIDSEPAWSGTTIAFSTNRDGIFNFEIYTMTPTGGSQTNITKHPGVDVTPAWSSDGTRIAFASNRSPGGGLDTNIFTMGATGGMATPIVTDPAVDVFPDW